MPNKPEPKKRPWRDERKPFQREKSNAAFYNSSRWRKIAKLHKEINPFCVECEKEGKIGPAEVTDHKIRIEDGGAPYDFNNLQSLCHHHHNQKSGREAHGYMASGN